jgi:hypothetical protein
MESRFSSSPTLSTTCLFPRRVCHDNIHFFHRCAWRRQGTAAGSCPPSRSLEAAPLAPKESALRPCAVRAARRAPPAAAAGRRSRPPSFMPKNLPRAGRRRRRRRLLAGIGALRPRPLRSVPAATLPAAASGPPGTKFPHAMSSSAAAAVAETAGTGLDFPSVFPATPACHIAAHR